LRLVDASWTPFIGKNGTMKRLTGAFGVTEPAYFVSARE